MEVITLIYHRTKKTTNFLIKQKAPTFEKHLNLENITC